MFFVIENPTDRAAAKYAADELAQKPSIMWLTGLPDDHMLAGLSNTI
jgi:hypothetical protein